MPLCNLFSLKIPRILKMFPPLPMFSSVYPVYPSTSSSLTLLSPVHLHVKESASQIHDPLSINGQVRGEHPRECKYRTFSSGWMKYPLIEVLYIDMRYPDSGTIYTLILALEAPWPAATMHMVPIQCAYKVKSFFFKI